ncbi:isoprenoid synthase domain-containing protein [Hygrophoropsis aurantiaca]|uniref:Isoprenoid synthase domain-containing protein n=1 Tax=Hygrophoropsis aurantiaca TaxID=72124 RepID=A0ACB8AJP1_9AGAM|nr:isoprenoid synthase domain-containing protein [Hygrophoropsis aurantiaca]
MLAVCRRHLSQQKAIAPILFGNRLQRVCYSSTSASAGNASPIEYCRDYVRKHDYEGFLTSQVYPKHKQGGYFAIKAFYIELAMIQESVSNVTLGQMRMQFWRDAIKDISNNRPPRHPIALALYETSQSAQLQPYHFKRIIDARESELSAPAHLTVDSLTSHAESTASTFFYLSLALLSLSSSTLTHAASHLGIAQSLSTLIRALPFHTSKGRMVIPAEITARHGVNQQHIFTEQRPSKGLEDATFDFATVANDHLITARDMFKETGGKVPQEAIPVFSAAIPVASFLRRLEKANFNAFDPSLQVRDWKLPWQVWRGYYKRTF